MSTRRKYLTTIVLRNLQDATFLKLIAPAGSLGELLREEDLCWDQASGGFGPAAASGSCAQR